MRYFFAGFGEKHKFLRNFEKGCKFLIKIKRIIQVFTIIGNFVDKNRTIIFLQFFPFLAGKPLFPSLRRL